MAVKVSGVEVIDNSRSIVNTASATITGDLTVDSNTLHVDSTNDRVGIGTSSPAVKLDIVGENLMQQIRSSTSNNAYARYQGASGTMNVGVVANNGYIGVITPNNLRFLTDSTERMRIDSSGNVDIMGELIAASYNETFAAVTSTAGAATIDCETGNVFAHTLTENTTFTFSNPPATGTAYGFTLKVTQDSTARTITWPASVDWPAATAPTLSTGSGEVDVFVFMTVDGGTTWYGFTAGQVLS